MNDRVFVQSNPCSKLILASPAKRQSAKSFNRVLFVFLFFFFTPGRGAWGGEGRGGREGENHKRRIKKTKKQKKKLTISSALVG